MRGDACVEREKHLCGRNYKVECSGYKKWRNMEQLCAYSQQ